MLQPQYQNNRCLFLFTTFLWSTFFLATLVLYQVIDAYPGMVAKADTDPRARLFRAKEMVNIMKEIRQGDYKLVRPSISSETEVEQYRYCTYKLNAFLMTLCTSTAKGRSLGKMAVSLHKRGIAAEGISLCLSNQPVFRDNAANTTFLTTELNPIQQKQLVALTLAEGLTVLLDEGLNHYQTQHDGGSVVSMAQAAETVWTASFHHAGHIGNFLKSGIIQVLGDIIVSLKPPELETQQLEWGYRPARAVMWACAALQNLAANYCDNELGFCIWHYKSGQLVLDEETKLEAPHLATEARRQIAEIPHLLETLTAWVCQGPIQYPVNETYGWPGDALLWKDLTFNAMSPHLQSPSIVPWAAAGVLKNLLLGDEELRERIKALPNLLQCLCPLTRSPDWLEQGKSTEALRRWDSNWQQLCPDVYANCQDDPEWKNAESGDSCVEYEQERWCVEYGADVDENGKTANEACCACGGGFPKENSSGEEGMGAADENTTTDEATGELLSEATVDMDAGEGVDHSDAAKESAQHEEL